MGNTIDIDLFKKILSKATEKSDNFYFIRGTISCLTLNEFINVLDFNRKMYIINIYIHYLEVQSDNIHKKDYINLAKLLFKYFSNESKYFKKYRISALIATIVKLVGHENDSIKLIINNLMSCPYSYIRSIFYNIIMTKYNDNYFDILRKNWYDYYDEELIEIVVKNRDKITDFDLIKNMIEYYMDDDDLLDFHSMINRNILMSMISNKNDSYLNKIKENDSISYIFICKEAGIPIDHDIALKTYNIEIGSRRYLPLWISKNHQFDLLNKIMKLLK